MRWAEEALEDAIRDFLINIEFYQTYYPRTEDLDPFIQEACNAVYEIIGYKKV